MQLIDMLYGLTRTREIINPTKLLRFGISYQDTKNFYTKWENLGNKKGCR